MPPNVNSPFTHRVTQLLLAWRGGNTAAPEKLMSAVYGELRQMARSFLHCERSALLRCSTALVRFGSRQSEFVEHKFFGGLTTREIGEVLHVSEPTAVNDWEFARSWLKRDLDGGAIPS